MMMFWSRYCRTRIVKLALCLLKEIEFRSWEYGVA
jgi:hypothetical protein